MSDPKHITDYRLQLRTRILDTALLLFAAHGVRAVKMDDISNELGISKRTLYELYNNKSELLFEGMKKWKEQKDIHLRQLMNESHNVMDIIFAAYKDQLEIARSTNPLFFDDLEKFPEVLDYFRKDHEMTKASYIDFFQQGINQGYFLPQTNLDLLATLFDAVYSCIMKEQLYKRYTTQELSKNMPFVLLRGVSTEKGREAIDRFFASV